MTLDRSRILASHDATASMEHVRDAHDQIVFRVKYPEEYCEGRSMEYEVVVGTRLFSFGDIAIERLPNEVDLGGSVEGKVKTDVERLLFVSKTPSTDKTVLDRLLMTLGLLLYCPPERHVSGAICHETPLNYDAKESN